MPQILWREIRSRGTRPDWNIAIKEVEATLEHDIKPALLNYFQQIVASWDVDDAPQFKADVHVDKQGISVYVYPTGTEHQVSVWKWVSITGTAPHVITVRNAPYLKYRLDYMPRTTLSGGYKGPGAAVGPWRQSLQVNHPGFAPRNFEAWVRRWYEKKFRRLVENAFKRGIYRATHM